MTIVRAVAWTTGRGHKVPEPIEVRLDEAGRLRRSNGSVWARLSFYLIYRYPGLSGVPFGASLLFAVLLVPEGRPFSLIVAAGYLALWALVLAPRIRSRRETAIRALREEQRSA